MPLSELETVGFKDMILVSSKPTGLQTETHLMRQLFPVSISVKVIGGEDLPKVSTQALKQQYEKTIEQATPGKQIKVMMQSVYLRGHYSVSVFRRCHYINIKAGEFTLRVVSTEYIGWRENVVSLKSTNLW